MDRRINLWMNFQTALQYLLPDKKRPMLPSLLSETM